MYYISKTQMRGVIVSLFLITTLYASAGVPMARKDYMQATDLREVRLQGVPADKMNAFLRERMLTEFAQKEIFGEARSAFENRDDDELHAGGGYWRGEFWGKLMLSTARASIYLQDPALNQFIKEECYRMMALQDEDGYLGSYSDKELILIKPEDRPSVRKAYGWYTHMESVEPQIYHLGHVCSIQGYRRRGHIVFSHPADGPVDRHDAQAGRQTERHRSA